MKQLTKWLVLMAAMVAGAVAMAADSPTMVCKLTGKESKTCCCEKQKNGDLLCKNTSKILKSCCCEQKK